MKKGKANNRQTKSLQYTSEEQRGDWFKSWKELKIPPLQWNRMIAMTVQKIDLIYVPPSWTTITIKTLWTQWTGLSLRLSLSINLCIISAICQIVKTRMYQAGIYTVSIFACYISLINQLFWFVLCEVQCWRHQNAFMDAKLLQK